MTDADLIYNACLRAERKFEALAKKADPEGTGPAFAKLARLTIQSLREEIGNGLTKERR